MVPEDSVNAHKALKAYERVLAAIPKNKFAGVFNDLACVEATLRTMATTLAATRARMADGPMGEADRALTLAAIDKLLAK